MSFVPKQSKKKDLLPLVEGGLYQLRRNGATEKVLVVASLETDSGVKQYVILSVRFHYEKITAGTNDHESFLLNSKLIGRLILPVEAELLTGETEEDPVTLGPTPVQEGADPLEL